MTSLFPVRRVILVVTVCVGVVLTGLPLAAQTETPHSAFSLTTIPRFERQIWPGDFNRDGRTDLIGSAGLGWWEFRPTDLLLSIARSDRSFPAPRSLGIAADPIAVSDLNRDGFQDVVIRTPASIAILPGNGDGTFRAPRTVAAAPESGPFPTVAIVQDFTGDGHRDIAAPAMADDGGATFRVYPGRGDFTFGTPIDIPLGLEWGRSAIAGDFNGDSRPDLAVIPYCCSLYVLLNNGGLGFSVSEIPLAADLADITAGDLDRDGDLDLVVTESFPLSPEPGRIGVLLGNGSGAFAPPTYFDAGVKGEYAVVVGDFTRDGILDVATGNQSTLTIDDLGTQMSDSVSVLEGDGGGGLRAPVTFRFTYENENGRYQHTVHSLNTNDINRDGVPDLIASPGVVLLSQPPVPNRAPHAFAGPDRNIGFEDGVVLQAFAGDPDGHWLDYRWTDSAGATLGTMPVVYLGGCCEIGAHPFTLTVTDSLGASASDSFTVFAGTYENTVGLNAPLFGQAVPVGVPSVLRWNAAEAFTRFDLSYSLDAGATFIPIDECTELGGDVRECTWVNPGPPTDRAVMRIIGSGPTVDPYIDVSELFRIVAPPPATALPSGWQNLDVGAVAAAGSASFSGGTFTVRGSGADVWGTSDEFHFVSRPMPLFETNELIARVTFVGNVNQWTKAGLMIRSHNGPEAAHAFLLVTPTTVKGIAFQRRRSDGATSVHTAGPAITAPVWLRLVVRSQFVRAYYRTSDSGPWTFVGEDTIDFRNVVGTPAGLVVSSHVDGRVAEARFDNVTVQPVAEWRSQDIGNVGVPGVVAEDRVRPRLYGSGADIWGTADAFVYRYGFTNTTNVQVSARVVSVDYTHAWAKAGVMFRETLQPDSRHVMLIASPGRGVAMQYRAATGGISANVAIVAGAPPKWLRLRRNGQLFIGDVSNDGTTWVEVGRVTLPIGAAMFEGLAVTSHNNSVWSQAVFENVLVQPLVPNGP